MRSSSLPRTTWIHSYSLPLFVVAALTGLWAVLAPLVRFYDNPLLSGVFFTVTFFHVAISCWYVWFVPHRTRWTVLALALVVVTIFGSMCAVEALHLARAGELIDSVKEVNL